MFGYRLIREADYERDARSLASLLQDLREHHAKQVALLQDAIALSAEARSSRTMVDMLTLRLNELSLENATLQQKLTGLPQVATSIGTGSPIMSESLMQGGDLFADVGDAEADRLQRLGSLHHVDDAPVMPAAADLLPATT